MLGTARIAGIMAAKRTHELIPLCHPLAHVAGRGRSRSPMPSCPASWSPRRVKVAGPDRRRNGGADRGLGRLPDDLRHGQGGRTRHAHRGHPAGREARRPESGHYARTRSDADGAAVGRRSASNRVLAQATPLPAEEWSPLARGDGRVLALRSQGAADPAAGRRFGHGRLCGARAAMSSTPRRGSRSSAKSPPAGRSMRASAPAKRRAFSPAASCRPAPIPS